MTTKPFITLRELGEQSAERREPLGIDPIVLERGTVTFLVAAPNVGKTWLAMALAVHAARASRSVIFLAGEGLRQLPTRAARIASAEGIVLAEIDEAIRFNAPVSDGVSVLVGRDGALDRAAEIVVAERADLVIVDPLVSFFRADENSAAEAGEFMALMRKLAERDAAVLVLAHTGKSMSSRGIRGSSAFEAAADEVFEVSKVGARRSMEHTKARDRDLGEQREIELEIGADAAVVRFKPSGAPRQAAPAPHEAQVLAELARGPCTKTDLRNRLRVNTSTIDAVIGRLLERGAIERDGESRGRVRLRSGS
jgi:KaiC/GvpD/RAD55 family RecA-like ATPase